MAMACVTWSTSHAARRFHTFFIGPICVIECIELTQIQLRFILRKKKKKTLENIMTVFFITFWDRCKFYYLVSTILMTNSFSNIF